MTREEAIKILEYPVKKWSMEWDEREDGLSYYEAIDMAISALRQQDHFREATKKIEPITNADMIRAMSDEELADFLAYTWATSARAWQKDPGETLHWIQMPVEEDDHD